MKEIETTEIEQALQREREVEPSKFGTVALAESVDELVAEVQRLDRYVTDQLEVTPTAQQGYDSLGTYITKDW